MSLIFPVSLLETLQQAFHQEAKRLCKDAAKILHIPEKALTKTVIGKLPKNLLRIVDDEDITKTCQVLIMSDQLHASDKVLERCRGPCLLGTGRCLVHQRIPIPEIPELCIRLTRLALDPIQYPPLWCHEETKQVYNALGICLGEMDHGDLILYELDS